MHRIDLNCDLGEGAPNDEGLLEVVSSANVACGAHAGDPETMRRTVVAAKARGVAVGAHPGFPDRENFGRRPMALSGAAVRTLVADQVSLLQDISAAHGISVKHVKPHGALYNMAATDRDLASSVAEAVAECGHKLVLFGLAGSEILAAGERVGLRTAAEAFVDRTYESDGTLTPRSDPSAVIRDIDRVLEQAVRLVVERKANTRTGTEIEVNAETICIHGDTPGAPELARAVRAGLEAGGIDIRAIST